MGSAVALHGASSKVVEAMASKYARSGAAISQNDLSASFMLRPDVISKIVSDPKFVQLVNFKVDVLLQRDGRSAAVNLLVNLARDKDANMGHRVRAAELILSRTIPTAQPASQDTGERDLTEMSADELRGLVDHMQGELAVRGVNAPVDAPNIIDVTPIDPDSVFD